MATVLRQTGGQVRIIVARPVEPTSPDYQALASHAPIVPTKLLSDPEELERQLIQSAAFSNNFMTTEQMISPHEVMAYTDCLMVQQEHMGYNSPCSLHVPIVETTFVNDSPSPETETYEVELRKNVYGLGITVAGYVCEEEDLSGMCGIFTGRV